MDDRSLEIAFGAAVRRARSERGLTQDEVSRGAGLSRTSIVNIEAGRQGVALGTLYRLAAALGVAPADLLPDTLAPEPMPSITIGGEAIDSAEILQRAISQLEPKELSE